MKPTRASTAMIRTWYPLNGMLSSLPPSTRPAALPVPSARDDTLIVSPRLGNPERHAAMQTGEAGLIRIAGRYYETVSRIDGFPYASPVMAAVATAGLTCCACSPVGSGRCRTLLFGRLAGHA